MNILDLLNSGADEILVEVVSRMMSDFNCLELVDSAHAAHADVRVTDAEQEAEFVNYCEGLGIICEPYNGRDGRYSICVI